MESSGTMAAVTFPHRRPFSALGASCASCILAYSIRASTTGQVGPKTAENWQSVHYGTSTLGYGKDTPQERFKSLRATVGSL